MRSHAERKARECDLRLTTKATLNLDSYVSLSLRRDTIPGAQENALNSSAQATAVVYASGQLLTGNASSWVNEASRAPSGAGSSARHGPHGRSLCAGLP